jgi:hypothetical protein
VAVWLWRQTRTCCCCVLNSAAAAATAGVVRAVSCVLRACCLTQVYEYDRNLLQQDAVQFIAAYKYELGTVLATLSMAQFVRKRPRVCAASSRTRQQQAGSGGGRGGGWGGAAGGAAAAGMAGGRVAPLPKPGRGAGASGVGGRPAPPPAGARSRGGFSVANVLSAVGLGAGEPPPQLPPPQRTPLRTPPRSPGGE